MELSEMKQLANNQFQMNIIYGDTDSIFASGVNRDQHSPVDVFITTCKQKLGVDVDHQNTFVRSIIIGKKHYIGIQPDGKVIIKGMEGKKRDRPSFFNQVFSQLIDDYKNNKPDLNLNVLKSFQRLEAAEVDPSLLAYSVILNKDPDNYLSYTPQHRIGKSLNKEFGSLIKYYKTGKQEDGYRGYSTNYQDLDIDVYKIELWKLIKDVLGLLNCDTQKLEDQIFPTIIDDDTMVSGAIYSSRANRRNNINNDCRKANNTQTNESLDKYQSMTKGLLLIAR
jgi:DNA polymerase I